MKISTATRYMNKIGPGAKNHLARIAAASVTSGIDAALAAELFIRRVFTVNTDAALSDHGIRRAQLKLYVAAARVYAGTLAERLASV